MTDKQLRRLYQHINLLTSMLDDADGTERASLLRELTDLHAQAADLEAAASVGLDDGKGQFSEMRPATKSAQDTKPTKDREATQPGADWERVPELTSDEAHELFNRMRSVLRDVLEAAADLADVHPERWGDGRHEFFEAFTDSMLAHSMLAYDEAVSCGATERSLPYLQLLFGLRPALETAGRAWAGVAADPDSPGPFRDLAAMAAPIQAIIAKHVPSSSFTKAQMRIYPDYPEHLDYRATRATASSPAATPQVRSPPITGDDSFGGTPRQALNVADPADMTPAFGPAGAPRTTSGLAASALVIGILSLFAFEIGLFVFGAFGLSVLAVVAFRPGEQTGKWMAVVGLLISGGALLLHLEYYGHI